MTSRQLDEEAIFHTARKIADADGRQEYLDQICAGDQALRQRVEALLATHEQESEFLKSKPQPAATLDFQSSTESEGQEFGRYKLRERLGEGGFGIVWAAEQSRPVRRKVALKIIKPGMDSRDVVARFEAERQALALMDHPNIARVFDGGTTPEGRPYFVMELIRGVPITEYCDENRLTVVDRLRLFIDVCRAVQHAHQKGIIHRDIKPSNVLVTLHDNAPVPKVIDFGVAKAISQQLTDKTIYTRVHAAVGTLAYMAPEQAALTNQDIDTRADVYGLGVLLYELLTGTTPLDPKRLEQAAFDEAIRIIREEEPPKASTKLSSLFDTATAISAKRQTDPAGLHKLVRGELDWILLKALEKDRTRRYETASSFAEDIQRLLAHDVVLAKPPTTAYRVKKFVARNQQLCAGILAVALSLLAGIAASVWFAIEADQQRVTAENSKVQADVESQKLSEALNKLGEELYQRAISAVLATAPDAEKRITEVQRHVQLEPDRMELLHGLHDFCVGDLTSAATVFRALLKSHPDNVGAKAALATTMENSGEYDEWVRLAFELNDQKAERPEDKLLLAQALMVIGNPSLAVELAKQAATAYPSPHAFAIQARAKSWKALLVTADLREAEDAANEIRSILRIFGKSPYVLECALFNHVVAMILAGNDHPSFGQLRVEIDILAAEMLQSYPTYAYGRIYRAVYFDLVGRTKDAEDEYRALVGLSQNEHWRYWHALTQYRNGKSEEACQTVRKLGSYAMVNGGGAVLCDRQHDRELVLRNVMLVDNPPAGERMGEYHLRSLLFIGQRAKAEEMAKLRLGRLGNNLASWQKWDRARLSFYVDRKPDLLLQEAGKSPLLRCDAYSLIAADYLSRGDLEEARKYFHMAAETRVTWWPYYHIAVIFRERIDAGWKGVVDSSQ